MIYSHNLGLIASYNIIKLQIHKTSKMKNIKKYYKEIVA